MLRLRIVKENLATIGENKAISEGDVPNTLGVVRPLVGAGGPATIVERKVTL